MPNLTYLARAVRAVRPNTDPENVPNLPVIEEPHSTLQGWLNSLRIRRRHQQSPPTTEKSGVDKTTPEMQTMLPPVITVHRLSLSKMIPDKAGEVCLLTESPYRILRFKS